MPARSCRPPVAHDGRCALDRPQNALVCPTAAEMLVERLHDIRACRTGIAIEQRPGRNEDTAQAVTALAGLLVEKGLLQGVQMPRCPQALDGGDGAPGHGPDFAAAGVGRLAVDQHHAGAALLQATAVARPAEAQLVAQHVDQRRGLRNADLPAFAVHGKVDRHDSLQFDEPIRYGAATKYPEILVTNRAHVLLWTDSTAAYLDAVQSAGLADRVAIDTLPRKEKPSAEQLARTEALMAGGVPAGLLPSMPKLRWAQAMSAGVEQWLALPDLPNALTLTCARGTHTESMPENIVGALFHVAKPYQTAVDNQKQRKWVHTVAQPLTGKTLGILGLGAIGQEVARIVSALSMRVIGTKRRLAPTPNVAEVMPPERTDEVLAQSDFVLLLLP